MEEVSPEQAARAGIRTLHHRMDNGECRYRLMGGDGSGYIRTEATKDGGWQRSHYHVSAREMYIVQSGWMDVARMEDGKLTLRRYNPGTYLCLQPGARHNIRMGPGAVIHTVKFGNIPQDDWYAAPELDALLPQR